MKTIHEALTERGLLPGGIQSLKTSYFDNVEVEVGFVQPWASAKSLQILLTKEPNTLPADIWRYGNTIGHDKINRTYFEIH